jgi:hypothetical protein
MSLQRRPQTMVPLVMAVFALLTGAMAAFAADDPAGGNTTVGRPGGWQGAAPCAGGCATGACCSRDGCCPCEKCPPPLVHCTPKPPTIKFKCVCPLPVCNPCDLQGYGYYPTCWRPWLPPLRCPDAPGPALNCSVPVAPAAGGLFRPQTEPVVLPQRGNENGNGQVLPQGKSGDDMLPPTDH